MFPRYLRYLLLDFCQTFVTGASRYRDELIRFWGQKVKVQGHGMTECIPDFHVSTISPVSIDRFSPNFCHWCILGHRWPDYVFGSKGQRLRYAKNTIHSAQQLEAYRAQCCASSANRLVLFDTVALWLPCYVTGVKGYPLNGVKYLIRKHSWANHEIITTSLLWQADEPWFLVLIVFSVINVLMVKCYWLGSNYIA